MLYVTTVSQLSKTLDEDDQELDTDPMEICWSFIEMMRWMDDSQVFRENSTHVEEAGSIGSVKACVVFAQVRSKK